MTAGQESSASTGRSGSDTDGRLVPPQASYWDIDLLTPDDVCALLKVKKSWLYDAVEDGALEAIRLGKQLRFRPSALVRYLDERASNGTKDRPEDRDNARRDSRPRR
jgi:excisionase family DNA binding protein